MKLLMPAHIQKRISPPMNSAGNMLCSFYYWSSECFAYCPFVFVDSCKQSTPVYSQFVSPIRKTLTLASIRYDMIRSNISRLHLVCRPATVLLRIALGAVNSIYGRVSFAMLFCMGKKTLVHVISESLKILPRVRICDFGSIPRNISLGFVFTTILQSEPRAIKSCTYHAMCRVVMFGHIILITKSLIPLDGRMRLSVSS